MRSAMLGQSALQEFWGSVKPWLTSISAAIGSVMQEQSFSQECCRSAQRWFTSISMPGAGTM
jgi:hypothetical protein